MEKEETNIRLVPAAEKTIRITEYILQSSAPEFGVSELAAALGMNKGTVYSILQTMIAYSWINKNPVTGKYYATNRLSLLSNSQVKQSRTVSIFQVLANAIEKDCGELVNLHYPEGLLTAKVVAKVPSTAHTIRVDFPEGATIPVICSSAGKCLISQLDEKTLRRIYELSGNRFTEHTIQTEDEFLACIENVRKDGYAVNNAEFEDGVYSVAAPLYNHHGRIIAAINIVIPSVRFTEERKSHLIDLVLNASKKFSEIS